MCLESATIRCMCLNIYDYNTGAVYLVDPNANCHVCLGP